MTKEEIVQKWNSLSPRERDAWIDEAVRGYKKLERLYHPPFYIPNYSTEITAAWEVVEKYDYFNISPGDDGFVVIVANEKGKMFDAEAKTVPEAICLAALIAHYETN